MGHTPPRRLRGRRALHIDPCLNPGRIGCTPVHIASGHSFDYDGQITQISQGGTSVDFAYDALRRRYSRTAGGTTTVFQYSGSQVLREKQGANYTATYTYGNALIRKDSEVPLFDGLGSERTVTDGSPSVIGTLITEGFGQTVATTGSSTNSYMFAATSGYRNDGDAGLMHVGARYYDAQVGRFVTRDTFLDQKPYLYCEHNPVNALDPSGHDPRTEWDIMWGGIGTSIGGRWGWGGATLGTWLFYKLGDLLWPIIGNIRWDVPRAHPPKVYIIGPYEAPPWGCGGPPPGSRVELPYMGPYR